MDNNDYDENVTIYCANCRDAGCSGWYVLDPTKDTRLQPFVAFKVAFCSAECVCEYLDIPFYNDDELDKDSFSKQGNKGQNMDGVFRIIGVKRTDNGWRFVAEPEHCTIEFTCSNPETDMMAWNALKDESECEIRFNDEGKADLIGIVPVRENKHGNQ